MTLGDQISPKDHPKFAMLHIPPKNFVCCIPNAVSQTKRPVDPKGMKQHNKKYCMINMNEMNETTLYCLKQCHN